jgi:hypothetical protein
MGRRDLAFGGRHEVAEVVHRERTLRTEHKETRNYRCEKSNALHDETPRETFEEPFIGATTWVPLPRT